MSLRFPYQDVPISGPVPATLPANAVARQRPLVPVRIVGTRGFRDLPLALIDSGAVDSVFSDHLIHALGIDLVPSAVNQLRWRGQGYLLRFGRVTLQLTDGLALWTWQSIVAFSTAPIAYPLLGHTGCLEYMDVQLLGSVPELILDPNGRFPGICE